MFVHACFYIFMAQDLYLLWSLFSTDSVVLFLKAGSDQFNDLRFEFLVRTICYVFDTFMLTRWPAEELVHDMYAKVDWISLPTP